MSDKNEELFPDTPIENNPDSLQQPIQNEQASPVNEDAPSYENEPAAGDEGPADIEEAAEEFSERNIFSSDNKNVTDDVSPDTQYIDPQEQQPYNSYQNRAQTQYQPPEQQDYPTDAGFGNIYYTAQPPQPNQGYNPYSRDFGQPFSNNPYYPPYQPYYNGGNNPQLDRNTFYPYPFQNSQSQQADFRKNVSPKKHTGLKAALLSLGSVAMVALIAFALVLISSNESSDIVSEKSEASVVQESSYGASSEVADAPEASASEDGPQISISETSESQTASLANSAYTAVSPSIVCITSYEAGTDYTLTETGEGSGIIITSDGYIATNSHVVDDSKDTGVMITLSTGEEYLGTIIGIDTKTDLAVIKIEAENLTAASFADSDMLVVGQEVYAIGNPGGSAFSNSLTLGTVSAINRVLSSNSYVKYIQTDAAINPGNSGGALVNEYGQVIGMNTAKISDTDYEGMGFAIPSNTIVEIVNKLIKYGYVNDRATLSIEGTTCTLYNSKLNNVPQGMIITKINSDSPLASTQAMTYDIITAIDDIEVTSTVDLIDALSTYLPGDTVTLTIFRIKDNSSTNQAYSYTVEITLIQESND